MATAPYDKPDESTDVRFIRGCSVNDTDELVDAAAESLGLNGQPPDEVAIQALIAADGNITEKLLAAVVPGWDVTAGVPAARKFIEVQY